MRAKKRLGQNFLSDKGLLTRIVDAAEVTKDDTVLEIGPGYGSLTDILAERAKKVIAVELDEELYIRLKKQGWDNVELLHGNALLYPIEEIEEDFKIVANPPYNISSPLLYQLIEKKHKAKLAVLTLQKDVALRITAVPSTKSYGTITVFYNMFAKSKICFDVDKNYFKPIPSVDSSVLRVDFEKEPKFHVSDMYAFFKLVKGSFFLRRKMLYNSLRESRIIKNDRDIKEDLLSLNIEPTRRGETLSLEEFVRMADFFSNYVKKANNTEQVVF